MVEKRIIFLLATFASFVSLFSSLFSLNWYQLLIVFGLSILTLYMLFFTKIFRKTEEDLSSDWTFFIFKNAESKTDYTLIILIIVFAILSFYHGFFFFILFIAVSFYFWDLNDKKKQKQMKHDY